MTREEEIKDAIESLEIIKIFDAPSLDKAVKMAVAALRAQQSPLDRSRWEGCNCCKPALYDHVGFNADGMYFQAQIPAGDQFRYCPICGRPRTEEAWAELERRINVGKIDKKNVRRMGPCGRL